MSEGQVGRCFLHSDATSALGTTVVEAFAFAKGGKGENKRFALIKDKTKGLGEAFRYTVEKGSEIYRPQPESSPTDASQR